MANWLYRVLTINTQYQVDGQGRLENSPDGDVIIQNALKPMGESGWELVAFLPAMPGDKGWRKESANPWIYHAIFKKLGPPDPPEETPEKQKARIENERFRRRSRGRLSL